MARHSTGVLKSRLLLLFLHQMQNIRAWKEAVVQEAFYLKQLLGDFGVQQKHPTAIGEDNQNVSIFVKTQSFTRGASTLRKKFTSFSTRRKMRLFQFQLHETEYFSCSSNMKRLKTKLAKN